MCQLTSCRTYPNSLCLRFNSCSLSNSASNSASKLSSTSFQPRLLTLRFNLRRLQTWATIWVVLSFWKGWILNYWMTFYYISVFWQRRRTPSKIFWSNFWKCLRLHSKSWLLFQKTALQYQSSLLCWKPKIIISCLACKTWSAHPQMRSKFTN